MTQFTINVRETSHAHVLELNGHLDAHTAPQLEQQFQEMLDQRQYNVIVDFRELAYISSAGLGVFMAYIEDMRKNLGDIKLAGMSPKIYNVFDLLGFPMLYEIYDDQSQAHEKFQSANSNQSSQIG